MVRTDDEEAEIAERSGDSGACDDASEELIDDVFDHLGHGGEVAHDPEDDL